MAIPSITTLPTAPSRTSSPATFNTESEAFIAAMVDLVTEMNTAITQMNLEFTATDLEGAWSAATGSKTAPKIFSHNNSVWLLHTDVADITTQEPSASNDTYYLPIGNLPVGEAILQTLSGASPTWTMTDGAAAELTLSVNAVITLGGEPSGDVVHFAFLRVIQDPSASGYTLGFSGATVETEDGLGLPVMSSAANAIDDYVLYTVDNGVTYGIRQVMRNVS